MLVDAMEEASRPECHALPCGRVIIAELHVQLALPASFYPQGAMAIGRCD
jgi:hypothetical protein